jgi:TatA/E family protein of Tat protein translocase
MGTLGVPEMAVIFILALVLFGPKKLPELGRTIGKAMTEFRRHSNDLKATFDREMQTLERENQSIQQTTRDTVKELASYEMPGPETMWNPLEQVLEDEAEAIETAQTQELPAPVGASEVSGAELSAGIEGTVPRSAAPVPEIATAPPEAKQLS